MKKGTHPNSLANLQKNPNFTKENAAEMARRSHEVRREKAAAKKALESAIGDFKDLKVDMPPAVDVLRVLMAKAIQAGDDDETSRLAMLLAPFETPKLASKEVTVNEGLTDRTDEELKELLEEFKEELH